jgi:hypothetical protein
MIREGLGPGERLLYFPQRSAKAKERKKRKKKKKKKKKKNS